MRKQGFSCAVLIAFTALVFSGCATMRSSVAKSEDEDIEDVTTAVGSIAEAVVGRDLSEQEMKNLSQQIKEDKETQEVVGIITNSLSSGDSGVKYCPVSGKRYAPHLTVCPEHQVELKTIQ